MSRAADPRIGDANTDTPTGLHRLRTLIDGRSRRHRFVRDHIVEARWFHAVVMTTIIANAVMLWPMTDEFKRPGLFEERRRRVECRIYFYLNFIFVVIYLIEFVLKLYESPVGYWKSLMNCLESVILCDSIAWLVAYEIFGKSILAINVIQTLRIISVIRIFRYVKGLQVLLAAFGKVLTEWIPSVLLLVLLLLYLSCVVGKFLFEKADESNWGTLGLALVSVAALFSCDGWTDLSVPLVLAGYGSSARIFTAVVVCFGNFIVTNVVVGVILLNVDTAAKKFEKDEKIRLDKILRHKKAMMMMRERAELSQVLKYQHGGNFANFQELAENLRSTLKHSDIMVSGDLSANILWLETFLQTLNKMDTPLHNIQQLHYEMANNLAKALELKLEKTIS